MIKDEYQQRVLSKLDKIISLLESQNIVVDDEYSGCRHENLSDIGTMGSKPGERMQCNDCKAIVYKSSEGRNVDMDRP